MIRMEVKQEKVENLIPYGFNNRVHNDEQVDRIANSIREFGFNQPIVVDDSNIIIVGHGRFMAAKKLGLETVPVVRKSELTETQKKAYRILDNKLQNDSTWEFGNLEFELGRLEEMGFDLEAYGLEKLLIKPTILDGIDLGPAERMTDYTRTFTLTEEQAAIVDQAIKDCLAMIPEVEGNKNGAALTHVCATWNRTHG